jgi:hypothetical protein
MKLVRIYSFPVTVRDARATGPVLADPSFLIPETAATFTHSPMSRLSS